MVCFYETAEEKLAHSEEEEAEEVMEMVEAAEEI